MKEMIECVYTTKPLPRGSHTVGFHAWRVVRRRIIANEGGEEWRTIVSPRLNALCRNIFLSIKVLFRETSSPMDLLSNSNDEYSPFLLYFNEESSENVLGVATLTQSCPDAISHSIPNIEPLSPDPTPSSYTCNKCKGASNPRKRKRSSPGHTKKIKQCDTFLFQLRARQQLPWKRIAQKYQERFKTSVKIPALQMRYTRLRKCLENEANEAHQNASAVRHPPFIKNTSNIFK